MIRKLLINFRVMQPQHRHALLIGTAVTKLIDGSLELLAGLSFYMFEKNVFLHFLQTLFHHELVEDPNDILYALSATFLHNLSISTQHFIAFYMIVNGVLKVFLMTLVLKQRMWAYPTTASVLGMLVLYEIYRFVHTHSVFLAVLIIIDVAVMYLILDEYKRLAYTSEDKQHR